MRTGKPNQAAPYLEKAISLNPEYAQAYRNLGILHYEHNEYEKAIPLLKKALKLPGGDPFDLLYGLGHSYWELGDPERATVYFLAFRGKAPRTEKWAAKHRIAEAKLLEYGTSEN